MGQYNFELDKVKARILQDKAKRVLVQLPEGLKSEFPGISTALEDTGAMLILQSDPCYGACDIKTGYDLTVHFGHNEFIKTNDNVLYIPCHYQSRIDELLEKALPVLKGQKIGILTTSQHIHQLNEVQEFLKNRGKVPVLSRGKQRENFANGDIMRATASGQVLGCDVSAAIEIQEQVDSFLFIGSGKFHSLGIENWAKKPVIQANPYSGEVEELESGAWEKEKSLRISKAFNAKSFGIIISTKPGQRLMATAERVKEKLPNSALIELEHVSPQVIEYLPYDAFVITACPRIVIDDWKNYKKPILLPDEALKALQA